MPGLADDRDYALQIAKRYFYERNVELDVVMETFAETTDPVIDRLLDLMVHEPARTGRFITVSQRDYERNYWPDVAAVLTELEKGEAGVLPPPRPVTLKRLLWTSVLLVVATLSAAGNLRDFYWHVTGRKVVHVGLAAVDLGFGVLF